jgi:hypothetical protein
MTNKRRRRALDAEGSLALAFSALNLSLASAMYHRLAPTLYTERRTTMPEPQSLKNHTRFNPPWHFFLLPVALVNFIFAIVATVHHWHEHPYLLAWWIVMSIAFFLLVGGSRGDALKVQDRLIRLEERIRFAALLPPAELAASHALTTKQLIGLRFASDAELPALVRRTLAENLTAKQIKEAIVGWRPDHHRV